MRILMASAEVAPFARVGGLSDVVGALSKDMAAAGHDVSVFLPKYASIDDAAFGIEPVDGAESIDVPMGSVTESVSLYRCAMPGGDDVSVYFVRHDGRFGREGIYVDPATKEGYPDEVERYALFSRAVIESARALGMKPDVLHLNDHHTAMAAVYLKKLMRGDEEIGNPGVVFSIHNLGYLGMFDKSVLPRIGFSEDLCVFGSAFEYNGSVSTLKLGIEFADYVNTVSEQYAREISSSPEYGLGLEGVLAAKMDAGRLTGILNGVDYSVWDPSVDKLIPANFRPGKLKGKKKCKAELLARCGLSSDLSIPLIGMVSRLADQKGFDLVYREANAMIELGASLVILGTGQQEYHDFLTELAERHPDRVSANLAFDNELAHWIEAGSDMFLMPSRYEPCGLNQMYSLRYGTVPVVRATGGLVDTVEDYNAEADTGVGFVFEEYTAEAMMVAVRRAVEAFADEKAWARLVRRGMDLDFSWGASAAKYAELYGKAREAAADW